jgi:hypothetical protein
MLPARPRVGLLVPRFTVFDGALGPERVERVRGRRELLARALEPFADVVASISSWWRLRWQHRPRSVSRCSCSRPGPR